MESVLGIGRLTSLEVLDPVSGKSRTCVVRGKYLAWRPRARDFSICTIKHRSTARLSPAVQRAHKRFHLAPSERTLVVDLPSPIGRLSQVGLVKALTYLVPNPGALGGIRSPSKNNAHWHHAFGDTGHKGGTYTPKVMPALCRDRKRNLFICRRKGNIFTVDSWLRG